jgi:hypothetical protein
VVSIPLTAVINRTILSPYQWPRRALGERWNLRIPPEVLDSVAFLCIRKDRNGRTENVPGGTAFFVSTSDREASLRNATDDEWAAGKTWTYVVTARHCIEETTHQTIYVRINTKEKFKDIPTSKDDWFKHDDADVAAILLPPGTLDVHHLVLEPVSLHTFVTRDYMFAPSECAYGKGIVGYIKGAYTTGEMPIQLGDDLFFPGLFVQSAGTERNLPIARFGNISRMPSLVTLETKARGNINIMAYLAECHSWGGHSGSPVFWYFDYIAYHPRPVFMVALLGLVSAHFDIERENPGTMPKQSTKLNSGMAVVTPAENIRELLMRPDVAENRNQRRQKAENSQPAATLDSALDNQPTQRTHALRENDRIEIPIPTKNRVLDDLTKATRKRKPS